MAGIKVITPPAAEPVTLAEVLIQLKFDDPDPETEANLHGLIASAREWAEGYTNRVYVEQTLELALDHWPCGRVIELPRPPLRTVMSVSYGSEIWDAANYTVDDYAFVAHIVTNNGWPSGSLPVTNGIKIRYVAGYEPLHGAVVTGEALGIGDGNERTYLIGPVKPESVTLYFDGTPTSSYTIDYESGTVTSTQSEDVAVTIDYTEATDYAANVPQRVKQAILLLVTHWFENGMCDPPPAVLSLLNLDRVVPV